MTKKNLAASLIAIITLAPAFALAQTTSGTNESTEIAALQQLIVLLTQELQQLIAQHQQSAAPTSTVQSTVANSNTSTSGTTEYSSYTPVSMALYSDDPSAYLGQDVVVTGMVNTFMPEGGTGGTTNYIQIINPFDESQPKMQLEIDNSSAYSAAVTALQNTSNPIYQFVRAYGVGVPDQELTETSLLGSQNVMVPVVNVTRIDQCIHGSMNTTILTGTSFDDNFTCSEWETVAPASEAGTTYGTPVTTVTTPTTNTNNSNTNTSTTQTTANVPLPSCTISETSPQTSAYTVSYQSQNAGPGVIAPFNATTTASVVAAYAESYLTDYYQSGWNSDNAGDEAGLAPINPMTFTPYGGSSSGTTQFNSSNYVKGVPWVGFVATFITNNPGSGLKFAQCSVNITTQAQTQTTNTTTTTLAPALDSNATLSSLTVNGTSVPGFNPNTYVYAVTLPAGSPQAPTVTAGVADPTATAVVAQATDSLGSATVAVTAQNGTTRNTYTVNFRPMDAGQCNFNGNIFTCASDSGITVSPTTLPSATVGTNYSEPVTISDPDTSSPNFRWNGISGTFPPELGLVFNGSTAFECSGTYCYFTSAPQGISVPSGAAAAFFGTPTTAGTYSFTMQAIDSLNYIALPTFTITVASSSSQ